MRTLVFIFALVFLLPTVRAAEPTDDFVSYMKSVLNPLDCGLRQERYYPYLTPLGRRIGYGHSVDSKALYEKGWSREEADQQLRAQIADSLQKLRRFLAIHYPDAPLDRLDPRSQEILLDYAVTEGVENIGPEFYVAVIHQDWEKLIHGYLYVRYVRSVPGWPSQLENHAFAKRWIYSSTPLIPLKAAGQ